jgi:hypothetical protein
MKRQAIESPLDMSTDEQIAHIVDTTPWGGSPSSVSMALYDTTDPTAESDVSNSKLAGSMSVSGDNITCKRMYNLVLNHRYRAEVLWVDSDSNVLECWFEVRCR